MKKFWAFLLLFVVACAPAMEQKESSDISKPEPAVLTSEEVVSPAQSLPPSSAMEEEEEVVTGTPIEPSGAVHEPYSQLGCESLLSVQEFASACGKESGNLVVTYKIGTKNCFVNIKDRLNERLTAGITLNGHVDGTTAAEEFERRLKVLKVGADKSVGERAYVLPNPPVDRAETFFLREEFIVKVGTDVRLCDEAGMLAVAKIVDSRLE